MLKIFLCWKIFLCQKNISMLKNTSMSKNISMSDCTGCTVHTAHISRGCDMRGGAGCGRVSL